MRLRAAAICVALAVLLAACSTPDEDVPVSTAAAPAPEMAQESEESTMKIRISAGGENFTATLDSTQAANELAERLPMTLDMSELNGNEKFCYLDAPFASEASRVGQINAGDIMLFGDDCLVIFYESFATGYSYTQLGRIDDTSGLAEALGSGPVTVTIEAEN